MKNPYTLSTALFVIIAIIGAWFLNWRDENFAFILLLYFIVTLGIKLDEIAGQIMRSEYLSLFEKIDYEPVVVANTFLSVLKSLKRDGYAVEKIKDDDFVLLFENLKKGNLSKEAIPSVLENLCNGLSIEESVKKVGGFMNDEELRKIIKDIIESNKKLVEEKRISALMGDIMKVVRGRIDGKKVAKVLNELINEKH